MNTKEDRNEDYIGGKVPETSMEVPLCIKPTLSGGYHKSVYVDDAFPRTLMDDDHNMNTYFSRSIGVIELNEPPVKLEGYHIKPIGEESSPDDDDIDSGMADDSATVAENIDDEDSSELDKSNGEQRWIIYLRGGRKEAQNDLPGIVFCRELCEIGPRDISIRSSDIPTPSLRRIKSLKQRIDELEKESQYRARRDRLIYSALAGYAFLSAYRVLRNLMS